MAPILIAGSSIMEHWAGMENLVPGLGLKNIAVGGTTTLEWTGWLEARILAAAPRGLVFYCGSNDFNRGEKWKDIAARTLDILSRFTVALPEAKVAYLHVIRAPQKEPVWNEILLLKDALEAGFASMPRVTAVDPNPVFHRDGAVRRDLFIEDALHLTPEAYRQWGLELGPRLQGIFAP